MTPRRANGRLAADGRLAGHYVYMLLCRDEGPIYVKVGMSINPLNRMRQLYHGCPVEPRQLHYVKLYSASRARFVEKELHHVLAQYRTHGEWFVLTFDQRDAFNAAWSKAFRSLAEPGYPMRWDRVSVPDLLKLWQDRSRGFQRKFSCATRAVRDAVRDSRK